MRVSRILIVLALAGALAQLAGDGGSAARAATAFRAVTGALVSEAPDPVPARGVTLEEYDALRARAAAFR